jgi:hypothetical protein
MPEVGGAQYRKHDYLSLVYDFMDDWLEELLKYPH